MDNINAMIKWFEELTYEGLGDIEKYYAQDAYFKDPFNEFTGIDNIKNIFIHMFHKTQNPTFYIKNRIIDNNDVFLTWDFKFLIKNKPYSIHGGSHLRFGNDHRIHYHRDYWDTGEELMTKLPFFKFVFSLLKKIFSTK